MLKFLLHVRSGWEGGGLIEVRCLVTEAPDLATAILQAEKMGLIVDFGEQV